MNFILKQFIRVNELNPNKIHCSGFTPLYMNIKVKHLIFFSVLATVVVDTLVFYTFLLVTFFSKSKTFCPIVYLCLEKKVTIFLWRAQRRIFLKIGPKKFSSSVDIFCSVSVVWHGSKYLSSQVSLATRKKCQCSFSKVLQ